MSRRLDERAERVRERRQQLNRTAEIRDRKLQEAHQRWESGYLVPDRITMFLDARHLYGPEVDHACGVEEPAVDQWEAGELYPTWEQVLALAALCEVGPIVFTDAWGPTPPLGPIFICSRGPGNRSRIITPDPPILRFTREALAAHRARLAACPPSKEYT